MKELLKKASLTVATACLVAGGLVSVGWAYSGEDKSKRFAALGYVGSDSDRFNRDRALRMASTSDHSGIGIVLVDLGDNATHGKSQQRVLARTSANSAEKIEQQEPMPDELEINGQRYQKASSCELSPYCHCMSNCYWEL